MSLTVNFKHLAPWAHEIAMLPKKEYKKYAQIAGLDIPKQKKH